MSATLAIDTATPDTAAAACIEGGEPAFELVGPGPGGRPHHARALLGAVEAVVAAAGGWDDVGAVAVGVGPGSFTGIRVGVSTARALCRARELPLAAVLSTEVLAAGLAEPGRTRLGVIDARRGEIYVSALRTGAERAEPPVVCAPAALAGSVEGLSGAVGAGDGAVRFRRELEAAGVEVPDDRDPVHRLGGRALCGLALRERAGPPERVSPLYLRRPDAERWRERDRGN